MYFNGVDLTSVHHALSINKEIPPGAAARNLTSIAGLDGDRLARVSLQQSEYKVRVNVAAKTRAEAWEARKLLAAWAYSSADPAELIPTHWPDVHYMAVCKEIEPPEFVFGFATITVAFALMRPIAVDNIASTSGGSGSASMSVTGSAPARPVIRQTLAGASSDLRYTLDGAVFLRFVPSGSYAAGTVIEIDTAARSVTANGAHCETDIDYAASVWRPGFDAGVHTVASTDTGRLTVEWRNEWY